MKNREKILEEMLICEIANGLEPKGFKKEQQEMMEKIMKLGEELEKTLSPSQRLLYEQIDDLLMEHEYLCEKACFIKGFRLAQILVRDK